MYIGGIGALLVLILIIVMIVYFARRGHCDAGDKTQRSSLREEFSAVLGAWR